MARLPLTPLPPRSFPTMEGQVFERTQFGARHTYLFCGAHFNDSITGKPLDEPHYLFITWQDNAFVFRSRLTKTQIESLNLVQRRSGLTSDQMAYVAANLFRHWERDEYHGMGVI